MIKLVISEYISSIYEQTAISNAVAKHPDLLHDMDAICAKVILSMVFPPSVRGASGPCQRSIANLMSVAKYAPQHERLVRRLVGILVEDGLASISGDMVSFFGMEPECLSNDNIRMKYPEFQLDLDFLFRCLDGVVNVLRGGDALELLLFPPTGVRAEDLYSKTAMARFFGESVRDAVVHSVNLSASTHTRPLRILEIGAGTGGTTKYMVPALSSDKVAEYCFTDMSNYFCVEGHKLFNKWDNMMRYKVLNIEESPQGQGFPPHSYDIIIATNVLHATKDMMQTMTHVRELLAPDGLVFISEATQVYFPLPPPQLNSLTNIIL